LSGKRLNILKKEYGVTIFFSTHYMDEADLYADEIAIINRGKIVACGRSEELKHSLGGEIIKFTFEKSALKAGLIQSIRELDFVRGVFEDEGLSVLVSDAESALPHIMDIFKNEGVSVKAISITKPTLDDVFLKYVGTRLEGKERISEVMRMRDRIGRGGA
jgi:ABC-2 type transport system ATP-binding protein